MTTARCDVTTTQVRFLSVRLQSQSGKGIQLPTLQPVRDKSASMLSFRVSESAGLACNAKQHLRDLSTGSQAIKWLYNRDKK